MTAIVNGWLTTAEQQVSPHYSARAIETEVSLLVVHNISLPPGQFGGPYITDLFLGQLSPEADSFFAQIYKLRVSAHCLIRRDGHIVQYVSFGDNAWHAGVSSFNGKQQCNDFSIGIELEGTDDIPYEQTQYQQLAHLVRMLRQAYPKINLDSIVGHCDIAPVRKTDPGPAFDWSYFRQLLV